MATALLLLIPLVAMQFTEEVVWTLFDFVVAGALLFGAGLVFELLRTKIRDTKLQLILAATLFAALLLLWIELAVGIFD